MSSLATPPPLSALDQGYIVLLPSDLLVVIFSYLPVRPLFCVLSRVCQRFRRSVPLAVHGLSEILSLRVPEPVLMSFLNIDQLGAATHTISYKATNARTLGTRVTYIKGDDRGLNIARFHCQKLRSLDVVACPDGEELRGAGTSLTRLNFGDLWYSHGPPDQLYFPRLLELSIPSWQFCLPLFTACLSQLTSLSCVLHTMDDVSLLTSKPPPSGLQHLLLTLQSNVRLASLYSWINTITSLTSLGISCAEDAPAPLPSSTIVTEIAIRDLFSLDSLLPQHVSYPRLRQLYVHNDSLHHSPDSFTSCVASATQLRELKASFYTLQSVQFARLMPSVMSLHELHLTRIDEEVILDLDTIFSWKLPLLRRLRWEADRNLGTEHGLRILQRIVRAWPRLDYLDYDFIRVQDYAPDQEILRLFAQVLKEAELSGLQTLKLGYMPLTVLQRHYYPIFCQRKWLEVDVFADSMD